MTPFILIGAVMVSIALAIVAWPIFRARATDGRSATLVLALLVVGLPAGAALLYRTASNWSWDPAVTGAGAAPHSIAEMVTKLEERLKAHPEDVDGWLMLGRSQIVMKNFPRAVTAFGEAYKLSSGKNLEAVIGYGEAMTIVDEGSIRGKAGDLFEEALKLDATNQKALWYGGVSAAVHGNYALARDRWLALLHSELPGEVKTMLVQRVRDLDRDLGRKDDAELDAIASALPAPGTPPASAPAAAAGPATAGASISIHVRLAPSVAGKVPAGAPLFVLARDPTQPGPPFAAKRFAAAALPMDVEIGEQDAMMPGRTIRDAHQLVLVARFSAGGGPVAASGDVYGEAPYDLAKGGAVDLVIDRQVP